MSNSDNINPKKVIRKKHPIINEGLSKITHKDMNKMFIELNSVHCLPSHLDQFQKNKLRRRHRKYYENCDYIKERS